MTVDAQIHDTPAELPGTPVRDGAAIQPYAPRPIAVRRSSRIPYT